MDNIRPIDWWMFWIEFGILALMIAGIVWGVPSWLEKRRENKALQKRLNELPAPIADVLRRLVLEGIGLNEESSAALRSFPIPLVERDFTLGWRVLPEYKKAVEKWAQETSNP